MAPVEKMPAAVCPVFGGIETTRAMARARSSGEAAAVAGKKRSTRGYFCGPGMGRRSELRGWLRASVAEAATTRRSDSSSVLLVVARAVQPSNTVRTDTESIRSATFWGIVLL